MPGAALPGRAVPCLPSLPPALGLSSALHASSTSPPCPSAHRTVGTSCSERLPQPSPSRAAGQGAPGAEPTTVPPSTAPSRGTPAPFPARRSPRLLPAAAPGTAALAPVSVRTWSAEPRSWDKGCPESLVWPSPWPWTSNLPRRVLVQEAAGLRLESQGGNSVWR